MAHTAQQHTVWRICSDVVDVRDEVLRGGGDVVATNDNGGGGDGDGGGGSFTERHWLSAMPTRDQGAPPGSPTLPSIATRHNELFNV